MEHTIPAGPRGAASVAGPTACPSDPEAWIERVRALAPSVARWRDTAERERRLPPPLVEALRDAGMFALSSPALADGPALDHETAVRVIEELSRLDGSVGWNAMVATWAAITSSYLPEAGLREVYRGGPGTVIAGGGAPSGTAIPVPGGFRLTGRWGVASGCHQAAWMMGGASVTLHGKPRLGPDGSPELRIFVVPATACEILDTWHTMGLRGTGSHDWQLRDVFVPDSLSYPMTFGEAREPGVLSFATFPWYVCGRAAGVALGIARDAIETFTAVARTKIPMGSQTPLATRSTVQDRLGRAEALVRSGRALLYETVRALPPSPRCSVAISEDLKAAMRLACTHAVQSAIEAVDLMFHAAGMAGVYTASRLERCFRDVHVVSQHIIVAASNLEAAGKHLLGPGLEAGHGR